MVRGEEEVRDSRLADAFRLSTREVQSGRPGHETVVRHLSEVLFFQAVRAWAARADSAHGVLTALADPKLHEALTAMQEDPAHPWTLELLSRRWAMGRSAFAERFRSVMGEAPMRCLAMWRVQRAKRLLAESQMSRDRIAELVGYDSAASMSRFVRKAARVSPGVFRRLAR